MRKVISILGAAFILTTLYTAVHADIVSGAVLYFDARDNPTHPDAWTNLADAGGSIPPMVLAPALEEGPIKIPDIGINERKTKYYTSRQSAEMYGTKAWNPPLGIDDWTIEFLVRRNGDLFREEHQLLGINTLPEGRQDSGWAFEAGTHSVSASIKAVTIWGWRQTSDSRRVCGPG